MPTHGHSIVASSKNYRYSTNLQVASNATSGLTAVISPSLPGSSSACQAFKTSGVDRACRGTPANADGGYHGTHLLILHRKR